MRIHFLIPLAVIIGHATVIAAILAVLEPRALSRGTDNVSIVRVSLMSGLPKSSTSSDNLTSLSNLNTPNKLNSLALDSSTTALEKTNFQDPVSIDSLASSGGVVDLAYSGIVADNVESGKSVNLNEAKMDKAKLEKAKVPSKELKAQERNLAKVPSKSSGSTQAPSLPKKQSQGSASKSHKDVHSLDSVVNSAVKDASRPQKITPSRDVTTAKAEAQAKRKVEVEGKLSTLDATSSDTSAKEIGSVGSELATQGVIDSSSSFSQAQEGELGLIATGKLSYPPLCRRRGISGRIEVELFIGRDGVPIRAIPKSSVSRCPEFTQEALSYALSRRYTLPKERYENGVRILIGVNFKLF